MNKKEAVQTLALVVVCTVRKNREHHQMLTVGLVEEVANQWLHDYPEGSERHMAAQMISEKIGARAVYRAAAKRLQDSGDEYLIGEGLTARQVTAEQFASELVPAGCVVTWRGDRTFDVHNDGDIYRRRTVAVWFYSDVNRFMSAKGGNGQPLRTMAAVRRYLRLEASRARR